MPIDARARLRRALRRKRLAKQWQETAATVFLVTALVLAADLEQEPTKKQKTGNKYRTRMDWEERYAASLVGFVLAVMVGSPHTTHAGFGF